MIDFSLLTIGASYDRPTLARLWGYHSYNAISRGVVSPRGEATLIFFVTKEKQESLTQYQDHIASDLLFWEGEKGHGSDERIVRKTDVIHVFFRERHHMSFTYEGRAVLQSYHLYTDRPSKFAFQLIDCTVSETEIVAEVERQFAMALTEREAIVKSRVGQGVYRDRVVELWKSCSVTGFTKEQVLIASHIKPWKISSNEDRVNPYNGLLLVPTLDKLFDCGYIGFKPSGEILLSEKISDRDYGKIGVHPDLRLRDVPNQTKQFLEYHEEYIFDLVQETADV